MTLEGFATQPDVQRIALIRVRERDVKLADGLLAKYGGHSMDNDVADAYQITGVTEGHSQTGAPVTASSPEWEGFGSAELRAWIEVGRCFAAPLRCADLPNGRIHVGRSTASDLSLRSRSVSKLHAYFDVREDGSLLLTDAESKNGTLCGGRRLTPGEPISVQPGTTVQFGEVEMIWCTAEQFHGAVQNF